MEPKIATRIEKWAKGVECWQTCSTSSTATMDDPCRDHEADIGVDVYTALEEAWQAAERGCYEVDEVHVDGTTYRLTRCD